MSLEVIAVLFWPPDVLRFLPVDIPVELISKIQESTLKSGILRNLLDDFETF